VRRPTRDILKDIQNYNLDGRHALAAQTIDQLSPHEARLITSAICRLNIELARRVAATERELYVLLEDMADWVSQAVAVTE
jgi:hypothetical protein